MAVSFSPDASGRRLADIRTFSMFNLELFMVLTKTVASIGLLLYEKIRAGDLHGRSSYFK